MFGWRSARHLRRGLPKAELRRLWDFYIDLGIQQEWLKVKEPGDSPDASPDDWDADMVVGPLNK